MFIHYIQLNYNETVYDPIKLDSIFTRRIQNENDIPHESR